MNLGGFSIWRFLGVSALKSRVSRTIGIRLTKGGREPANPSACGAASVFSRLIE
jgi:hypothetical protein